MKYTVQIGMNEFASISKIEACKNAYGFVNGYLPGLKFNSFYKRTFFKDYCFHFHGHYDFSFTGIDR